jgi:aryl-alcohol dehydrogenase-like predicted oxidoreductase
MMVSRMGLGTMTFGETIDQAAAQRIADDAIARGVNLVDTADTYGDSEIVLGNILKANSKRDQVFLCTKVYKRHSHGEHLGRNSRTNITNALNNSLRRLQVDHVDLLQLHHPDPQTPIDETMRTLDTLIKAGKVRYAGCSNHYAWQIAYSNAVAAKLQTDTLVSVQSSYNMVDRVQELELLHFCRKFNVAFMVYAPLAAGLLAKDFDAAHPADKKQRSGQYVGRLENAGTSGIYGMIEELRGIAREQELALNQLATLWLLAKPVVTVTLMGGSKAEHFSSILDVADRTLDPALVARIDRITEAAIYGAFKNQPRVDGPGTSRA